MSINDLGATPPQIADLGSSLPVERLSPQKVQDNIEASSDKVEKTPQQPPSYAMALLAVANDARDHKDADTAVPHMEKAYDELRKQGLDQRQALTSVADARLAGTPGRDHSNDATTGGNAADETLLDAKVNGFGNDPAAILKDLAKTSGTPL